MKSINKRFVKKAREGYGISKPRIQFLLMGVGLLLTSCNDVGVQLGSIAGGGFSGGGASISVTQFQDALPASWVIDSAGKIYSKSATLSFKGTCSRGIANIYLYLNGVASASHAVCLSNNTFVFTEAVPSDGNYDLRFVPAYANGQEIASAAIPKTFVVDSTAPTAPTISNVSHVILSAAFTISGTAPSPDTVRIVQSDTTGNLSFSNPGFSSDYTLSPGQTKTYTFYAEDFAGNRSVGTSFLVSYLASSILAASEMPGAAVNAPVSNTGVGGGYLTSVTVSPYIMNVNPKTAASGSKLSTGLIKIGN